MAGYIHDGNTAIPLGAANSVGSFYNDYPYVLSACILAVVTYVAERQGPPPTRPMTCAALLRFQRRKANSERTHFIGLPSEIMAGGSLAS